MESRNRVSIARDTALVRVHLPRRGGNRVQNRDTRWAVKCTPHAPREVTHHVEDRPWRTARDGYTTLYHNISHKKVYSGAAAGYNAGCRGEYQAIALTNLDRRVSL
jgi:hypothetical protein